MVGNLPQSLAANFTGIFQPFWGPTLLAVERSKGSTCRSERRTCRHLMASIEANPGLLTQDIEEHGELGYKMGNTWQFFQHDQNLFKICKNWVI